jgi:hypothetical protein
MSMIGKLSRAAATAGACLVASLAWAAAPVGLEAEMPEVGSVAPTSAKVYELDTEMVVHGWVLCVSQSIAEDLVRAREESLEQAWSAYQGFEKARQCGRFAELRVILQEPLYSSAIGADQDARVFGALVNLADNWASAFVVSGSLSEQ